MSILSRTNVIREALEVAKRVLIITGAGISTDSNIPDYRSPGRPEHKPIQHNEFMRSDSVRRRYWTRATLGYPQISSAIPNVSHTSLSAFEERYRGNFDAFDIITQNVDGLHHQAGSSSIVELHGSMHHVTCMDCKVEEPRISFQARCIELNPTLIPPETSYKNGQVLMRPDGDSDHSDFNTEDFVIPSCTSCGSLTMKPSVVFFGDTLNPTVATRAKTLASEADMIVVLGSTLTVWSSYSLVRAAKGEINRHTPEVRDPTVTPIPVFCVNQGVTRADHLYDDKLETPLREAVPLIFSL